ncbi:hypothetical protein GCM10009738_16140 [Kitasatospora viridis]
MSTVKGGRARRRILTAASQGSANPGAEWARPPARTMTSVCSDVEVQGCRCAGTPVCSDVRVEYVRVEKRAENRCESRLGRQLGRGSGRRIDVRPQTAAVPLGYAEASTGSPEPIEQGWFFGPRERHRRRPCSPSGNGWLCASALLCVTNTLARGVTSCEA